MRYLLNESTDAYFNLASEEYLLKHTTDDIFYLWRNDNAIIVGKNQNTLSEINVDYVKEKNIKVVRRLTGGGAVYHDLGNIPSLKTTRKALTTLEVFANLSLRR